MQARPINHGTDGGYQTHIHRGIPPCAECKAAHNAYLADWKQRRRQRAAMRQQLGLAR